jgi:alpha-D-ribose 1-methylphosphonate 5-triphosphate synthase subunit PhnH
MESCGDLADFVRLVWEGLNFEFPETPRGEVVIFRGVELPESALESYRDSVGQLITWSMFSSFTEDREVAEEHGRSWRGGVSVLFELRSAWCRRLANGTYLLHPFAVLQVEAVLGSVMKLVEVELLEPGLVGSLSGLRPAVVAKVVRVTEWRKAAGEGDVRALARWAPGRELIIARDADGWTPLHQASYHGKTEAVKALASLGADVNVRLNDGATPVYVAAENGQMEVVQALVSLGADVNVPMNDGATPLHVAAQHGHVAVVKALASPGTNVNMANGDGATPLHAAALEGRAEAVKVLASLGADMNLPMNDGATPLLIGAQHGHLEIVEALVSLGADVNAPMTDGTTPLFIATRKGHWKVVKALTALGAKE